jgi:hypothetical protein
MTQPNLTGRTTPRCPSGSSVPVPKRPRTPCSPMGLLPPARSVDADPEALNVTPPRRAGHRAHPPDVPRPGPVRRVRAVPALAVAVICPAHSSRTLLRRVAVYTAYQWPSECPAGCGCSRPGSPEALLAGLAKVQGQRGDSYGADDAVQDRGRRQLRRWRLRSGETHNRQSGRPGSLIS